jgi:hypothetical protein
MTQPTPPAVPAQPLETDPEHPTTPAEQNDDQEKYDGGEIPRVDTDPLDDDQHLNDDQV